MRKCSWWRAWKNSKSSNLLAFRQKNKGVFRVPFEIWKRRAFLKLYRGKPLSSFRPSAIPPTRRLSFGKHDDRQKRQPRNNRFWPQRLGWSLGGIQSNSLERTSLTKLCFGTDRRIFRQRTAHWLLETTRAVYFKQYAFLAILGDPLRRWRNCYYERSSPRGAFLVW